VRPRLVNGHTAGHEQGKLEAVDVKAEAHRLALGDDVHASNAVRLAFIFAVEHANDHELGVQADNEQEHAVDEACSRVQVAQEDNGHVERQSELVEG
jgi:hypothetical protein